MYSNTSILNRHICRKFKKKKLENFHIAEQVPLLLHRGVQRMKHATNMYSSKYKKKNILKKMHVQNYVKPPTTLRWYHCMQTHAQYQGSPWLKTIAFWSTFHSRLPLGLNWRWVSAGLSYQPGADQAISHFPIQWWFSILTDISIA